MREKELLKTLLNEPGCLLAPGVYDGLSALLVEAAGFSTAFLSGGSLSFSRFGLPDVGLVTATEIAETISIIKGRSKIPLIVDMDTGFGNALNVQRTVASFERAGASALQMEDQVFPKRCGHMAGKAVISCGEMVGKIKAALDARHHSDTLIIARTDAIAVNGFEDALERGHQYIEAGCDVLFIEAPDSIEQMKVIGQQFGDQVPLVHNFAEGGGSPIEAANELQGLGYKIALFPVALLNLFVHQAPQLLAHILEKGSTLAWHEEMADLEGINQVLGTQERLKKVENYHRD